MKNKKINIIIFLTIAVLLIFGIIIILNKKSNSNYDQGNTAENISESIKNQLVDLLEKKFIDNNLTYDKIEELIGTPINSQNFIFGNDAYIMEKPNEEIIKKYDLSDLVEKQKKYVQRIKDEFLKEFKYSLGELKEENGIYYQTIEFTTMYYGLYILDLNDLIQYETNLDTNNLSTDILSDEFLVESYKYKVLAMEVLDKSFDIYKNVSKEKVSVNIMFDENGKPVSSIDSFSLLCNMNGITYGNASVAQANSKERNTRLEQYKKQFQQLLS